MYIPLLYIYGYSGYGYARYYISTSSFTPQGIITANLSKNLNGNENYLSGKDIISYECVVYNVSVTIILQNVNWRRYCGKFFKDL